LLLLVLGVSPRGEGSAPAADDQIDVQAVDEFMQSEMSELHIPGLAVAVVAGALAA